MTDLTIPAAADAQVDRWHPERNYGRRPTARVGSTGDWERYRSLFAFPLQERVPPGATIEAALLVLPLARLEVGATQPQLAVHRVLQPWREDEVTWRHQPAAGEAPRAYAALSRNDDALQADVTRLARGWLRGDPHNAGVLLRWACDQTAGHAVLYTSQSAWCQRWPVLRVRYTAHCPGCPGIPVPVKPLSVKVLNPVSIEPRLFELRKILRLEGGGSASHMQETSILQMLTVFVTNRGPGEVVIQLQVSPDGQAFVTDAAPQALAAGGTTALVTQTFARYARLHAVTPGDQGARLILHYQGQIG